AIAGVHFNFSFGDGLWELWESLGLDAMVTGGGLGPFGDAVGRRSERYMGAIRNLQRVGWLVPYLFGASPAVCKSFFVGRESRLQSFDEGTFYEPYATSLRMGDIGYQNRREQGVGVKACYDSLGAYINSLAHAIDTPAPLWEQIGVKVDGEYRQLNANILQIENEYYSSVRPKQILDGLEKPILALRRRGIRYLELRSLDVNAYHPLGVDESQILFLEVLLSYCLLLDSPRIGLQERWEIDRNLEKIAHRGRDPQFRLMRAGTAVAVRDWGEEVLDGMLALCELLDAGQAEAHYRAAVEAQLEKLRDPEATPSATMLRDMREHGEGFYAFARRLSNAHQSYFRARQLAPERAAEFAREAEDSLARQDRIETAGGPDFDTFLAEYFAQR
ncbi:MAG: hypothetical protein RLZ44_850, partial [Pseudomonadota bacterium]